jgi:hypothetical protein
MSDDSALDRTTRLVEEYLADFGGSFSKVEARVYVAKKGSALVHLRILPWEGDAVVEVGASVVEGAVLSADLLRELLEKNYQLVFGKFAIGPGGAIVLHHALLGTTLAKAELVSAVMAVAHAADEWDDWIVARAGGKTALARLRDDARRSAEKNSP